MGITTELRTIFQDIVDAMEPALLTSANRFNEIAKPDIPMIYALLCNSQM